MPRPDVRDERRQQILDAAARVFAQKGLDAARMEDIARDAGLSIGGLYWYYKGKQEVMADLLAHLIDPDLAGLRALLDAPGSLRRRLSEYIQTWAGPAQAYQPVVYEFYSLAARDAQARAHLQVYLHSYRAILADLIRQAVASGELAEVDPETAALLLAAVYEGLFELHMIDPEHMDVAGQVEGVLDLVWMGLERKPK